MYSRYNHVGHVCDRTNRIGIPATEAVDAENRVTYLFSIDAATVGLDPWRMIDYIDLHVDRRTADVWLDNGVCIHVTDIRDCVVYIQQEHLSVVV